MAMLEIKDLHVHYGVIEALKGISLEVNEGEIVALIGANGAGKTTMMQSISGIVKKSGGEINFLNESIMKANPKHIVEMGLTQVPEGRRIFTGMSVYENLMMGAFLRKDKDGIKHDYEKVCEQFPILKERMNQDASTLSGGEQQMLAMGRALMLSLNCYFWMSQAWGLLLFWLRKSLILLKKSISREQRFYW